MMTLAVRDVLHAVALVRELAVQVALQIVKVHLNQRQVVQVVIPLVRALVIQHVLQPVKVLLKAPHAAVVVADVALHAQATVKILVRQTVVGDVTEVIVLEDAQEAVLNLVKAFVIKPVMIHVVLHVREHVWDHAKLSVA